ncbi:MAG TPA: hypothetical protein VLC09_19230 [Polyangiaceae bacterium]|nr:hypothetical protein [Polyangiaceae bacterium]
MPPHTVAAFQLSPGEVVLVSEARRAHPHTWAAGLVAAAAAISLFAGFGRVVWILGPFSLYLAYGAWKHEGTSGQPAYELVVTNQRIWRRWMTEELTLDRRDVLSVHFKMWNESPGRLYFELTNGEVLDVYGWSFEVELIEPHLQRRIILS